ncbi:MAG TPA: hypothetical protein VF605_05755 [Allosphingosinicella sp.]
MTRLISGMLLTGLAAGCASAPLPPPVTTYAGTNCAAGPNLGSAIGLTPAKAKKTFTVSVPILAGSACLARAGVQTPYLVFALPADPAGKMIEVGAQMEGLRIFSPAITILDGSGNQVRSFAPDQYLYRGSLYSVQFVPRAGDRFVLVTADPARVGARYDSIAIGTSSTYLYGGASWTSGIDEDVSRTFSYEGTVTATVYDPAVAGG